MKPGWSSKSLIVMALAGLTAGGCSASKEPEWQPERKQRVFKIATRQLPPEPVYGALRWVRPPQVLPERKVEPQNAPLIMPVVQFEVNDKPLSEVALILAATAGYRSYCAGTIAGKKLSLVSLGTMDELAGEIEQQAGVKVVINHRYKEVRFLPKDAVTPKI